MSHRISRPRASQPRVSQPRPSSPRQSQPRRRTSSRAVLVVRPFVVMLRLRDASDRLHMIQLGLEARKASGLVVDVAMQLEYVRLTLDALDRMDAMQAATRLLAGLGVRDVRAFGAYEAEPAAARAAAHGGRSAA